MFSSGTSIVPSAHNIRPKAPLRNFFFALDIFSAAIFKASATAKQIFTTGEVTWPPKSCFNHCSNSEGNNVLLSCPKNTMFEPQVWLAWRTLAKVVGVDNMRTQTWEVATFSWACGQRWCQRGGKEQREYNLPSGNLIPPVREKWTIRRGIFTDEHICILHKIRAVVTDLATIR